SLNFLYGGTLESPIVNRGNIFLHQYDFYFPKRPPVGPPVVIKGKVESTQAYVSITAADLEVQNKIRAKKGTTLYVERLKYGADDLSSTGKLEILFRNGGIINAPLHSIGNISVHTGNSNVTDTLEIVQPIHSEKGRVNVKAAKLKLKNKLIGIERHITVRDEFEYEPEELYGTSPLRITCYQGGDVLKKTINNGADIHIEVPYGAPIPFTLINPVTAGYKPLDATTQPGPANVLLDIKNGGLNKGLTGSPLIKSETGNVELKLAEIDMIALQCEAKNDVALEIIPIWSRSSGITYGKFNLGDLAHPHKVSLKSGRNCFFKQTGSITTDAIDLTAHNDLLVNATTQWLNTSSKIKLGGTAHLQTPLNNHRLDSTQDFIAQRVEANGKTTFSFEQDGELPFVVNTMHDAIVNMHMKKLTVKHPIHSQEGEVLLSAFKLDIQNKISSRKGRFFSAVDIEYETDHLYDRSLLALYFVDGGKIRKPLLNLGPIFIQSSLGSLPLTIEDNIIAGFSKDPTTTPAPDRAHLNIY
ncbi:MAG TPA: hypothetical protein VI522_08265, partial [Gammaproteobacteria bacterium]|nr:hypothetical protein [Gammaproteobacteria bacterium]